MPELVELDRDELAHRIAVACAAASRVAAALLYGSALGKCRPDSDVDVGLIRRPQEAETDADRFRAGLTLEYEVEARLPPFDGHPFHITVLDPDQPLFAMTVWTTGRMCYVGDADAYTDFLERIARGYRENAPRYEVALREVLEEPVR